MKACVGKSVLVVDRLTETGEVLRAVLERRGLTVYAAEQPRRGLEMARRYRPDVIVVDLEVLEADPSRKAWSEDAALAEIPRIVLGSARQAEAGVPGRDEPDAGTRHADHYLPKPYHYVELIHAIDELLAVAAQRPAPRARAG